MAFNDAKSWVRFQKGQECSSITAQRRIQMHAISNGSGWHGLHLETGTTISGWDGDDMMVDGHFISMNMADKPLHFEMRAEDNSVWLPFTRQPGALWVHPEGRPFSLRHTSTAHFGIAIIDGKFLDSLLDGHHELRPGIDIVDKVLEHLFRALVDVLQKHGVSHVTESLIRSFVLALGTRHGVPAMENPNKGGLSTFQLNRLLKRIDEDIDTRMTVTELASSVDLSVAHFSREFKRSTGRTPWDYIVEKRLQRASSLLKKGESACSTAMKCGFFDQAHLSRLFKQRFGVPPSVFAKQQKMPDTKKMTA